VGLTRASFLNAVCNFGQPRSLDFTHGSFLSCL
jgi:hypothetical protein